MRYLSRLLLIFAFIVVGTFATSVFANQSAGLLPISDGNYVQWTPKIGSTHYSMVNEVSCDGATSYNSTTTVGNRDSYGISLSSIPDGATITQLSLTPCASRNLTGGTNPIMDVFYRLNGVDSSDMGSYSLSGTTPTVLASTSFTGLSITKSPTTTLEVGVVLTSGSKGARLSNISTVLTYTPLAAPSGLSVVATGSAVKLTWVDNSSNESGFKIERSDNGGSFVEIATVGQNVKTYTNSNLSVGTYTYRVRAYNSGGNSTYTSEATAVVLAAPSNLLASVTGQDVSLTWTDNSNNEDGFRIERRVNGGQYIQIDSVAADTVSYFDPGLTTGAYEYRVRGYKGLDTSSYSASASATVQ